MNEEEQIKIQQALLEREVDEELALDKRREFFKKYQNLMITLVVGTLTLVAAFNIYQSWWQRVRRGESDAFEKGVMAAYNGQTADAQNIFEKTVQDRTDYKFLGRFRLASLLFEQGKTSEGLGILEQLMKTKSAPEELRSIARLSWVGHQLDTGKPADLQAALVPLLRPDNAFFPMASEQAALLALKEGDTLKAKGYLEAVLKTPNISEIQHQRLEELLTILGE